MNSINKEEQKQLKQELDEDPKLTIVPFSELLRYSTFKDKIFMFIGALSALLAGSVFPLFNVIFGQMTDSYAPNLTTSEVLEKAGMNSIWFLIVGFGAFICSFIMYLTWITSGEKQAIEFRKRYYAALLEQEIAWYDKLNPNELATKVATETATIQNAIGEKVPTFLMAFSGTFFGFLIGFIWGWQLALVVSASFPAISFATSFLTSIMIKQYTINAIAYAEAGGIAEESLNAIKTVKMLNGEDYTCDRYTKLIGSSSSIAIKFSLKQGLAFGLVYGIMFWFYAIGFWYGSKLISEQTWNHNKGASYTAGDVFTIFFSILTGGFQMGQIGPCLQSFSQGKVAAASVINVIDRKPKIKNPINPIQLKNVKGELKLENVVFKYSNNEAVLKSINLIIPAGKRVALVGESGCGKSTIMQLIERFYDPDEGTVYFDGIDIRKLDLNDLRKQIGYVSQEPVLFATNIRENLSYGKADATDEEMIQTMKEVNIDQFNLDTKVGSGGSLLSGGQKQRIAIARGILKKPKVLLLDEATSALDKTNEVLIQKTLDEVSSNITTVIIAHRLQTIQKCDIIYVIDQGVVVEQGTHDELIKKQGKYEQLARNQFAQQEQQLQENQIKEENCITQNNEKENIVQIPLLQNPINDKNIVKELISESKKMLDNFPRKENAKDIKYNQVEIQIETAPTKEDPKDEKKEKEQLSRLFDFNRSERLYLIFGIITTIGTGSAQTIFSLFLARMMDVLTSLDPRYYPEDIRDQMQEKVQKDANEISLIFFIIGIVVIILWTLQQYLFTNIGEKLTFKVREATLRKLLRMPSAFFDKPENNAGTLASRLAVDCISINTLTSSTIKVNFMNLSSLISGLVIAFIGSWQLTLIAIGLSPIVYIQSFLYTKFKVNASDNQTEVYLDSSNLIMESVMNMRTVKSFGNQKQFMLLYSSKVQKPLVYAFKKGIKTGFAMGVSQSVLFIIYAALFFCKFMPQIIILVGALLHKFNDLSFLDMLTSIFAIMFATQSMGSNASQLGDVNAAKIAAKNIFEILDQKDEFEIEEQRQTPKIKNPIVNDIEFRNVSFKYPSRENNVFENLSFQIKIGQKVGLVGQSGCGKSSILQILLRFYEPSEGIVLLDGQNLLDYDIKHLRHEFATVFQEPVLFNGSVRQNLVYNLNDINDELMMQALEKSNAIQFIQDIKGLDLQVGSKGSQISGGQKQRIAIARAILRNPNILLLDEATSALDSVTEQLVQKNLDELMKDKTQISIAHRISTIRDSNQIFVFSEGKIMEQGTYTELTNKKGIFYNLEKGIKEEDHKVNQ